MNEEWAKPDHVVRLFLAGDVMTGRAIDQLFAIHNSDDFGKPDHSPAARLLRSSAQLHGSEMLPLRHDYIWGSALGMLDAALPDFRLANLETSITTSDDWQPKNYNYRMHPANVGCLKAGSLDCVSLANNHVLDFGEAGLIETMATLQAAGIGYCGAGSNSEDAARPHVHLLPNGQRILVFAWAFHDSFEKYMDWAAGPEKPGIQHMAMNKQSADAMRDSIEAQREPGDLVIASLHWGGNWVEKIPTEHRLLARFLIDHAHVDVIHGHSSHHILPAEIYKKKLVLYGCGDLIDDTEASPNWRPRNGHLGALYFVDIDPATNTVAKMTAAPVQRRRFRLEMASDQNAAIVRSLVQPRDGLETESVVSPSGQAAF